MVLEQNNALMQISRKEKRTAIISLSSPSRLYLVHYFPTRWTGLFQCILSSNKGFGILNNNENQSGMTSLYNKFICAIPSPWNVVLTFACVEEM